WLKKVVQDHAIDAVVSDNRFGLYHKKIPCIFITHQLKVKSPLGKWSERLLQKRNYRYINRFKECWVPDTPDDDNLAGELSHPGKKPGIPLYYIGPLSRFQYSSIPEEKNHLLFLLSGPEPQRTLFENRVVAEIAHYNGTAVIVRGLPGENRVIPSTNMIRFYNHLPTDMLSNEIGIAEFIISRSGYSTVMDMSAMKKKCVFIPTPGQTEQEYLAEYLEKKQFACFLHQHTFSLAACLEQAAQFKYRIAPPMGEPILKKVIERFCNAIRASAPNNLSMEKGARQQF
ncbi:MAG TPA: glycosyltransferase, partial [Chitinophagaceae bacterium]|nr:glycosyltransferase [Chitinophagaceae bacterium]